MNEYVESSQPMTDLEMTKLCAKAMGNTVSTDRIARAVAGQLGVWTHEHGHYYPLHSDVQAMALLKRFRPIIDRDESFWYVTLPIAEGAASPWQGEHEDLNRAIVEAVAKMQRSKA